MRLTGEDGINVVGIVTGDGDGQLVDGRWTLGSSGSNEYTFTGIGSQTTSDPDFYLR